MPRASIDYMNARRALNCEETEMATYVVKWEIELEAESPEHAAELAGSWQHESESWPVFVVHEEGKPGLTWTIDTEKLFA